MLTEADIRRINAEAAKAERERDARLLAEYQRECEASWEGKTSNVRAV